MVDLLVELEEAKGILNEIFQWIKDHNVLDDELYKFKREKVKKILSYVDNMNQADLATDEEFGLIRFVKLDDAQKAFVILAMADKRLIDKKPKTITNLKLIVNTSYLNQVKWFSRIRDDIKQDKSEKLKKPHINNYLIEHPHIKRLGCGEFALNFHKHIKNLFDFIMQSDKKEE